MKCLKELAMNSVSSVHRIRNKVITQIQKKYFPSAYVE